MAKKKGKRKYLLGDDGGASPELLEAHRELHLLRVEGYLHDHRQRGKGQRRVRSTRDDPSGLIEWAATRAEKLNEVRGTS